MFVSSPTMFWGAGFSPLSLSPSMWLMADKGTFQNSALSTPAVSDGDAVGGWIDQSGNGANAVQSISGSRATLKLNIQNGLPTIRFNGTTSILDAPLSVVNHSLQHTYYVVARTAVAKDNAILWTCSGSGAVGILWRVLANNSIRWLDNFTVNGVIYDEPLATATNHFVILAITVKEVVGTNGVATHYENGVPFASSPTISTVSGDTSTSLEIGGTNSANVYLNGDIGECVAFPTAHNSTQITQMFNYLDSRWNVY